MPLFDFTVATDEDVAIKAAGDYARLVPADQRVASGADGVIAADGWTLTSVASPLGDRGVEAGHVVSFEKSGPIGTGGDLAVVGSVAGQSAVLRRKGYPEDVGDPVAPGGATGLKFAVRTAYPQLAEAARMVRRRLRIAADAALDYADDLKTAVVLTTLLILYQEQARQTQVPDDYAAKAKLWRTELVDEMARLAQTYGPDSGADAQDRGLKVGVIDLGFIASCDDDDEYAGAVDRCP